MRSRGEEATWGEVTCGAGRDAIERLIVIVQRAARMHVGDRRQRIVGRELLKLRDGDLPAHRPLGLHIDRRVAVARRPLVVPPSKCPGRV